MWLLKWLITKKLKPVLTELFIRGRKLNISIVFITQSSKGFWLKTTHLFITKIENKRELQEIALNNSLDIDFKDYIKFYKKYTAKPYSFLVNDTTLPLENPLIFRKNLLDWILNQIYNKSWLLMIRL